MLTVLVVDDEDAIRRVLRRAIAREGVDVHTAATVESAKRCIGEFRIDGAFLDVRLGRESGFDLYTWIQGARPQLAPHVVFTTGDAVNDATHRSLSEFGRPVLAKPFNLSELIAHVREWKSEAG